MGIILRSFQEELVAIGQMMLRTGGSRGERRFDTLRVCQLQCAIHLIGRDMVEALALILLRQRLPVEFCSLQQTQSTHHVSLGKGKRVLDTSVHMTLCCQVDNAVHLLVLHQLIEGVEVADVHLHEFVVGFVFDVLQVCEVSRIRQFVEVNDVILGILVHEQANNM